MNNAWRIYPARPTPALGLRFDILGEVRKNWQAMVQQPQVDGGKTVASSDNEQLVVPRMQALICKSLLAAVMLTMRASIIA